MEKILSNKKVGFYRGITGNMWEIATSPIGDVWKTLAL
jgi:hypothetical protein